MKRAEREKLRKRAVQHMLKAWVAHPKAERPSEMSGDRERQQLNKSA
jgi:hypothetical protein